MPSGEFFPAGIPHSSLSPPGNPRKKKMGVSEGPFSIDMNNSFSYTRAIRKQSFSPLKN
jgi:hypothetical protein